MTRRGTVGAADVQRALHDRATPREWNPGPTVVGADGSLVVNLYGDGAVIATLRGARARENADLIVSLRNTLPEHLRSFDHLMDRIRILEQRLRELEPKEKANGHDHHQARKGTRVRLP